MPKNINACFSHNSDDWKTPSSLYDSFISAGYLDPCPFKADFDGLKVDYYFKKLFINPPYSQISKWVDYGLKQFSNGCDVVFLIPARTDTKYFHKLLVYNPFIVFIKGRLHFNDSKDSAPFPSLLVFIGKDFVRSYGTM